ncbi:T9SS type A sorting domain-containing protein [candidate division KSB1 bacterium]|nr:T9SS type A sorting domain-containing protein [candidate division KSB1 bacterium]
MKVVKMLFIIALLAGQGTPQTYQATIQQIVADNTLVVDLLFETTSGIPDRLGDAVLSLQYNDQALSFIGKDSRYDGLWDADYSPSYLQIYPEDHAPRVMVHIVRTGKEQGVAIPSAPTRVIRLLFEILNREAVSGIQWDLSHYTSIYDWEDNFIKYKFTWIQPGTFPVPVELTGFTALQHQNGIHVNWTTATETNCMGFDLLRSTHPDDGFVKINATLIPGAGDSQIEHSYSFVDKDIKNGETYYYQLVQIDYNGNTCLYNAVEVLSSLPEKSELLTNYPNPFNSRTVIGFRLQENSHVQLDIYSLTGEKVATLLSEMVGAGNHTSVWNGRNEVGETVASGTYFYRLKSDSEISTRKMLFLR